LKKQAVKLATELKSKDPSASVDPETVAAKKRSAPLPTFQLPDPVAASVTLNAQDGYTANRRAVNAPTSTNEPPASFLQRAEYSVLNPFALDDSSNAGSNASNSSSNSTLVPTTLNPFAGAKVNDSNPNMVAVNRAMYKIKVTEMQANASEQGETGFEPAFARKAQSRMASRLDTMHNDRQALQGTIKATIRAGHQNAVDTDASGGGNIGYSTGTHPTKKGASSDSVRRSFQRNNFIQAKSMKEYNAEMMAKIGEADRKIMADKIAALPKEKQMSAPRNDNAFPSGDGSLPSPPKASVLAADAARNATAAGSANATEVAMAAAEAARVSKTSKASVSMALDYAFVIENQEFFTAAFKKDLAASGGFPASKVSIVSIEAGSVIVVYRVAGVADVASRVGRMKVSNLETALKVTVQVSESHTFEPPVVEEEKVVDPMAELAKQASKGVLTRRVTICGALSLTSHLMSLRKTVLPGL